jgi:streptogramin lyase
MKTKKPMRKPFVLIASAWVCCALNLHGQGAPTITNQPVSQTNLAGANVTFSVEVSGAGPFNYQWQFNGTNLPNNIITTVAGSGRNGYNGDGGAATNANLYGPVGVALDSVGNLYIADTANGRVRRVGTNGIITTVAGGGFGGDGGEATNASLSGPYGVVLDASGDLYVADYGDNCIREVNTNGIITTVAGNGTAGYSGDGGEAINAELAFPWGVAVDGAGNLFIADTGNSVIRKVDTNGVISTVAGNGTNGYTEDGVAATNTTLDDSDGVAVDALGNLFITDTSNNRIRKVDTAGIITTSAGTGTAGFSGDGGAANDANINHPTGAVIDPAGNLYFADSFNFRIREVNTNGIISTVAGKGTGSYSGDGGPATAASLYIPMGVALDAFGNLYIADTDNNRIRRVLLYAQYPTLTLANVSVFNAGNYSVVVTNAYGSVTSLVATLTVEAAPVITVQPASQSVGEGSNALLSVTAAGSGPMGYSWYDAGTNLVQAGTNSTLLLSGVSTNNGGSYSVVVANPYGSVTSQVAALTIAFPPAVTNQLVIQTNLAGANVTLSVGVCGTGPFAYRWQFNGTNILDYPYNIITTVAGKGGVSGFSGDGGPATEALLSSATGVSLDAYGDILIADCNNNERIRKVDLNGIITTVAGDGVPGYSGNGNQATNAELNTPSFVIADAAGSLYLTDEGNNVVREVATNGIINTLPIGVILSAPDCLAFDASGNLFVCDENHNRILRYSTNGTTSVMAGVTNGSSGFLGDGGLATHALLNWPSGIAFDATGNLYIADTSNNRIRKVDINGIITTVAGGKFQFSGDGGPATNAGLPYPMSVGTDRFGNIWIPDYINSRVRKVDTNGIITTAAGNGTRGWSGDGGPATNASLGSPMSVATDLAGDLFIADLTCCIREVHFAGFPTLTLTNVSTNNAGSYSVIVSSPYGSVTSLVAALTVQVPPQIVTGDGMLGVVSNQFGFNVSAAAGEAVVVEGSADLVNWTPVCTNTPSGGSFYFSDACWTNSPGRFYRARLQ